MLVTTVLITTNIYNSVKAPLKREVSYLEIWMVVVLIPIFIAIIEYGIILSLKKFKAPLKSTEAKVKWIQEFENANNEFEDKCKKIDFWTLIFSAFVIIVGNVVYWFTVLTL